MKTPKVTRPKFPKGYADNPVSYVDWNWVAAQLTESKHYWLSSVRPNGTPHIVPRWAVYMDGKIYYDGSPETRHVRNIEANPNICVNLESGTEVIMLEGVSGAAGKPSAELATRLSAEYKRKYKELGYAPEPDSWDGGGLFVFTPRQCIAWTKFNENPTKFMFEK
jgi:hypothetical protein